MASIWCITMNLQKCKKIIFFEKKQIKNKKNMNYTKTSYDDMFFKFKTQS